MSTRETFHSLAHLQVPRGIRGGDPGSSLPALLDDSVIQPFRRMTGLHAVVTPLNADHGMADDASAALAPHPQCAPLFDSAYCRESAREHLAITVRTHAPIWHRCRYGRFCALVPVVCAGRCVAVARFVCGDDVGGCAASGHAELLGVLVENFVRRAASLSQSQHDTESALRDEQAADALAAPNDRHPQVARALGHIAAHLADPGLSVRSVAQAVGSHPDYLAHLFATQLGRRMSRYITELRIARARELLTATNRQIKQVAWDVGFANPNWFSHVFRRCTGVTPTTYRRQARHPTSIGGLSGPCTDDVFPA